MSSSLADAFRARWRDRAGRCEVCDTYIPEPVAENFAHLRGARRRDRSRDKQDFVLVCRELHRYEHTRARNLRSHPCVMRYLDRFGEPGKRFWERWWVCRVDDCDRPLKARGLCGLHYYRWWRHGDVHHVRTARTCCSVAGCDGRHAARGYCRKHYRRWQKHGDPSIGPGTTKTKRNMCDNPLPSKLVCLADDCERVARARGYCTKHYRRVRLHNSPYVVRPTARLRRGPARK